MPRACSVCGYAEREAIDRALVAGESCTALAARYSTLGRMSLERHKAKHLPAALSKAQEAAEVAHGDNLLAQVRDLQAKTLRILAAAETAGALNTALSAIREARGNIELLGRLMGELAQEGTVNIVVAPEWVSLRTAILVALDPFPEARTAVVGAISGGDR